MDGDNLSLASPEVLQWLAGWAVIAMGWVLLVAFAVSRAAARMRRKPRRRN